jgi:hypothetical protein
MVDSTLTRNLPVVKRSRRLDLRHHNGRFRNLMDKAMQQWRLYLDELNGTPLAHKKTAVLSSTKSSPFLQRYRDPAS